MAMMETNDYYLVVDAAAILGMTPQGVRQKIKRGQLAAIKLNGDYWILRADVDARTAQPQMKRAPGRPAGSKDSKPRIRTSKEAKE